MSDVLTIGQCSVDECGIFKTPRSANICEQRDCPGGISDSRHPHFENRSLRIQSFASWPVALQPRPQALADAGFFYIGQGDRCVCFSCGNGLENWEIDDDPWLEHKKYFPSCPFVIKETASGRISRSNLSTSRVIESPLNAVPEALLCKVCYLEQMCMTFLPCKHVSSCESCASCLTQCPICREKIMASFKVFLQ